MTKEQPPEEVVPRNPFSQFTRKDHFILVLIIQVLLMGAFLFETYQALKIGDEGVVTLYLVSLGILGLVIPFFYTRARKLKLRIETCVLALVPALVVILLWLGTLFLNGYFLPEERLSRAVKDKSRVRTEHLLSRYDYEQDLLQDYLRLVISSRKVKLVEPFVLAGADINFLYEDGETPYSLGYFVSSRRQPEDKFLMEEELKRLGAHTFAIDEDRRSDLHGAVARGDLKALGNALAEGIIPVDFKDLEEMTPLTEALIQKDLTAWQMLIEAGADSEFLYHDLPLSVWAAGKDLEPDFLSYALEHGAYDGARKENFTYRESPLAMAILADNREVMDYLFSRGAYFDPDEFAPVLNSVDPEAAAYVSRLYGLAP